MQIKKVQGSYHILNSKEKKNIFLLISSQWAADFKTDLIFIISAKEKIFLVNREFESLPLDKLRIDKMGLYFGIVEQGQLRLSIEGSEFIGPLAKKNVVELSEAEAKSWLHGVDLNKKVDCPHFVILKHDSDFLGTAKPKGDILINFVPKNRRILVE